MHLSLVTSNHAAPVQDFSFFQIYLFKHLLTLLQILGSADLADSELQCNRWAGAGVVVMIEQLMRIHCFTFSLLPSLWCQLPVRSELGHCSSFQFHHLHPLLLHFLHGGGRGGEASQTVKYSLIFTPLLKGLVKICDFCVLNHSHNLTSVFRTLARPHEHHSCKNDCSFM